MDVVADARNTSNCNDNNETAASSAANVATQVMVRVATAAVTSAAMAAGSCWCSGEGDEGGRCDTSNGNE